MISHLYLRPLALVTVTALSLLAAPVHADEPAALAERRVRAHVTFLADDLLEGRDTGTRGHGLAMNYVATQFMRLGLESVGHSGYQQPLALRQSRLDLDAGKFVIRRAGSPDVTLAPINDMIARPAAGTAASELTAPAVFVGFAIHAPEFNYSDFAAGIDVRGKIAVVLAGSPKSLPATAKAH